MLMKMPLSDWLKLTQILAIVFSGIAAYLKFFHGRLFWPRLEPSLHASIIQGDKVLYLTVDACLKNVGLTSVPIDHRGTAILVSEAEAVNLKFDIHELQWKEPDGFDVFLSHQWIESGESIHDQLLIAIPNDKQYVFRVDLKIFHSTRSLFTLFRKRETKWERSIHVFTENHKPDKTLVFVNGARRESHATS